MAALFVFQPSFGLWALTYSRKSSISLLSMMRIWIFCFGTLGNLRQISYLASLRLMFTSLLNIGHLIRTPMLIKGLLIQRRLLLQNIQFFIDHVSTINIVANFPRQFWIVKSLFPLGKLIILAFALGRRYGAAVEIRLVVAMILVIMLNVSLQTLLRFHGEILFGGIWWLIILNWLLVVLNTVDDVILNVGDSYFNI